MNNLIPQMSVTEAINELSKMYISLINKELPYSSVPSPFLWGPPGVGKSDGIRELGRILESETGKKVVVTDVRLLLFSPIDLRGVPVADESRQFTDWLKPRILDFESSNDVVNILFLDELSAAPQSVQAAAYQITLNRAIGEHKLPENTIVMAAGNRTIDRSVAYKMPSALANRMMHFDICVNFEDWAKWAVEEGDINPLVLDYLTYANKDLYHEDDNLNNLAYPTPRSWMFVSEILNSLGEVEDIRDCYSLIASCIGLGTASEFVGWCKIYKDLPNTDDIFKGKKVASPTKTDVLYELVGNMVSYVVAKETSSETTGISIEELENASRYCTNIPVEFAITFFIRILSDDTVRMKLMKSKTFIAWSKKHKNALKSAGFSCE